MVNISRSCFRKFLRSAKSQPCRTGLCALAVLATCAGCGDGRPSLFPVHGAVVFSSGEPVRQATIELVPEGPSPSPRGKTDVDGRFTIGTYGPEDGAPAGEYRVVVLQVMPPRAAELIRKLGEEHAEHGGKIPVVSLKYSDPQTSNLAYVVKPNNDNQMQLVVEPR